LSSSVTLFATVALAWVDLRDPYGIEREFVVVRLCEPKQRFVASRKLPTRMSPEVVTPDDAVPKLEAQRAEHLHKEMVQRHQFALIDEAANLPTQAPVIAQLCNQLIGDACLPVPVLLK